jgi:hypothetical protein
LQKYHSGSSGIRLRTTTAARENIETNQNVTQGSPAQHFAIVWSRTARSRFLPRVSRSARRVQQRRRFERKLQLTKNNAALAAIIAGQADGRPTMRMRDGAPR